MERIDWAVVTFLNGFSRKSWTFDTVLAFLEYSNLLKGGVIVAILWAMWFRNNREGDAEKFRKIVLATFAGTFVALLAVHILHEVVPFRVRPLHNPALGFLDPYGVGEEILRGDSSFPSDHATLLSGLVAGIFLASRPVGLLAFGYLLLFILFPRVYLGLHYPSDIIGGAFIGVVCVALANWSKAKNAVADPLLSWSKKHPEWFYFLFFIVTYQTATLYKGGRDFAGFAFDLLKAVASRHF